MSHIHVCLVSDQTIPNILPVVALKPDELLLLTTSQMEAKGKSDHILACLKGIGLDYDARHHKIEVVEDSITDCQRKLSVWMSGREDADFVVNLTGGTKIMSIAAFEQFKDYGSKMFYIPIGRNEMVNIFPKRSSNQILPLTQRLKVDDYLAAYGLTSLNHAKLPMMKQDALDRKEIAAWIAATYPKLRNLLFWLGGSLRKHRNDRKPYLLKGGFSDANGPEHDLLQRMGFTVQGDQIEKELKKSEIQFLTGGWLEEYCFNELNTLHGKGIDDLVIGITIKNPKGTSNEFDVMFTRDNALYTVECKSGDQQDDKSTDALYKVAALQKEFGLRVGSFFVSTSPHIFDENGNVKTSITARAEQFTTTVVAPDQVAYFGKILRDKLKISLLEK
jgi:hypothetical protein